MDNERLEEELLGEPLAHNDISLRNQKRAELLRRRIEELDRRLVVLKGERRLWQSLRANRAGLQMARWPKKLSYKDKQSGRQRKERGLE
jgi:hypothetical protein